LGRLVSTVLEERYGRGGASRRRPAVAAAIVAALVALGFIAWVTIDQRPALTWDDVGYHVVSDGVTEVTFDVSFSRGAGGAVRPSAVCTVAALNDLRTEVGRRDVRVQAGPKGRVRATVTLRTSEPATTGLVASCVPV
jgi:hypothetical protein